MTAAVPTLLALVAACSLLAACESTQDKASKLSKSGSAAFKAKGLRVGRTTREVGATSTVVRDKNGVAVVVALHNRTRRRLARVPIALDVRDRRGKTVFRNNDAGLERSLVSVSALEPGAEMFWVNDQVLGTGQPSSARVKVGTPKPGPKSLPSLAVGPPHFERDPVSGLSIVGKVRNHSRVLQRKVVLYAVARKGNKVVAAGTGGIEKIAPGKSAAYQVFFIGNPAGARLTLAAPPTTFQG